jgi:signal transduction histidine kinase
MNLRLRLLLTNLLVLALGLLSAGTIAHSYKARQFPRQVQQMQEQSRELAVKKGANPNPDSSSLGTIDLFNQINDRGTVLALTISFLGAGGLSLWMTYSILRPLKQIEQAAKRFSSGDLKARVPASNIPEIHQLGLTLNSVANRLSGVEERRQALIGDLAHELATPLTVIRGYMEMLESGKMSLTPAIGRELHEEAERMNRLLEDLQVLSRVEAGNLPLRLQPLYLRPILQQTIALFHAKGWQANCALVLDCPPRLPMIFADPDRLKRILTNLISNALAYTPEGTVTVRASVGEDCLWVEVVDTGIGISEEELPHIFDRFWRSPQSRHLRCDGSGIGLAITKRLVEAMGGKLEVESQLGKGTTFWFCLPLTSSSHLFPGSTQ